MGRPKALIHDEDSGSWLRRATNDLVTAGCSPVVVVLGAAHEAASALLPEGPAVEVVVAEDWAEGMGHSLRAGLAHLQLTAPDAVAGAVVMLVDLPDVTVDVLTRVVSAWAAHDPAGGALARATYDGRPGHPVVLGRDHWAPLLDTLHGDVGAQGYLTRVDVSRSVDAVECADLATGRDLDRPEGGQG
jgi:CTP:molybdopterin cytidylyltransferase MocA